MARQSSLWQRGKSGFWYTTIKGRQIRLARDKEEARKALYALLAHDREPEVRNRPTFKAIAEDFLERSHEANAATTFAAHRRFLQSFADHVRNRRAPDIRGEHVTAWLRSHPGWNPSTRALAVQILKAAFNYAVVQGKLAVSPIKAVKKGQMMARRRIPTPEELAQIHARIAGSPFSDFVRFLELTGCRPFSEAAKVTAAMVDWRDGTITFAEHKTARHGKRRVIYLTPEASEILKRLAAKHPTGLLFRTRYGEAWSKNATCKWMQIFKREMGIKGMNIYALRHAWITQAIERGIPLPIVAELAGNSVEIVLKNYSHVDQKREALKEAARKAST